MPHVLIVDDDAAFRAMLTMVLAKAGHSVAEAEEGAVALRILKDTIVDVLVTDLVMPGKEGVETILAVKKLHPELPIIAMSGSVYSATFLELAVTLGADRALVKPFPYTKLLEAIDEVLRKQSGEGSRPLLPGPECVAQA